MEIKYLFPYWGNENLQAHSFFDFIKSHGFDGVEINVPKNAIFETEFYDVLLEERKKNPDFICVLQQVQGVKFESPSEYLDRVLKRLDNMVHYQPNFINSHTGKDHFSFDDNCRIIEAIETFSEKKNIPVYHEIHRGRFNFHPVSTLNYLDKFPNLKLVGDFSHWCVVSESLLQDQPDLINSIAPNIFHLHARIGTEQASQVNNPFATEWNNHLNTFTSWWKEILHINKERGLFTITPEFGPFPYMPQEPFTEKPLAIQNEINIQMKDYLKSALS